MNTSDAILLFIKSRQARGLSPQTIRWYYWILNHFESVYPIADVTPEQIDDFVASCVGGDERRHGYYRALKAFYRFLNRRYQVANPILMVDAPRRRQKEKRALMPDDIRQLLAYPHHAKIYAALVFMIDTGARVGELVNLSISDLTETPWGYTVLINGKTGERRVPISYDTYHQLMINLPFGFTAYRLRIKVAQAFKKANVKGSAHTLRHTFATLWDGDEITLQRILGHKSINTTLIYRHSRMRKISEEHALYSPLKMVQSQTREMDFNITKPT